MTIPEQPKKMHLAYLDGLRAYAAMYVVLHHIFERLTYARNPFSGFMNHFLGILAYGHYAVDLFIVLSGFCLMLPVVRNQGRLTVSPLRFLAKRAKRILPPYYAAMALSVMLVQSFLHHKSGTPWDRCIPITVKDIAIHGALLQDVFDDTALKIDSVLWSVSVEWRIYFLFPLIVVCYKRLGAAFTTGLAIVVAYLALLVLLYVDHHYYPNLNLTPWGICPQYLALFALGVVSAHVAFSSEATCEWRDQVWWDYLVALNLALVVVLTKVRLWGGQPLPVALTDMVVGLGAACLLIGCALGSSEASSSMLGSIKRLLELRLMVAIGMFAYSIYLIHDPILQLLWEYGIGPMALNASWKFIGMCLAGIPIVLLCSYLFYLICERPFLNTPHPRVVKTV